MSGFRTGSAHAGLALQRNAKTGFEARQADESGRIGYSVPRDSRATAAQIVRMA